MKITKYVHSCLLVESDERVGLIDPGEYSWASGLFDLGKIARLDDIVITHEHADHMSLSFIKALVAKFPEVHIVTTPSAQSQLANEGISGVSSEGNEHIELFEADHETIEPLFGPPQNIGVNYLGELSHPGDSHHFASSKPILALPITAPWGTVNRAAELGRALHPKYVIPIHDWHYRDEARFGIYGMLEQFFDKQGIVFIKPTDGQQIAIDL